ncbi:hypothetical protein [Caballeronia sp. SL2Y3]|uniref:hypothetical protein n=1 Tax=Caballeronia sp. SL2Y3 TaxID=2878151 RepID=UPI001FD19F3A|nr:hypothetical protein [Caballeronia sp. SL2Y3]
MTLDDETREAISRMPTPPFIMDEWEGLADSLARKFEWKGSKIDWAKCKNHSYRQLTGTYENWIRLIGDFIKSGLIEHAVLAGDIFYMNDSSLDFAVRVRPEQFYDFMSFAVLNIPQHHYFFDETMAWCLVISAEGYVDFGISIESSN